MLQAILAEEWDKSIHVRSEKIIEYSNASPADGNGPRSMKLVSRAHFQHKDYPSG